MIKELPGCRTALVICPYFTNGTFPPLGAAYINAVLRQAGYQVDVYDFQFLVKLENPKFYKLLIYLFTLANDLHQVDFLLSIKLTLYYLFPQYYENIITSLFKDKKYRMFIGIAHLLLERYRERLVPLILNKKPKVILFSAYITNLFFSLYLAQEIKKRAPRIPIIFGGFSCGYSEVQNFILDLGFVDGIVVGEGEPVITRVLERIEKNGKLPEDITGFVTRTKRGDNFKTVPQVENLDTLPFPSFEGFPLEGYDFKSYQKTCCIKGCPDCFTQDCKTFGFLQFGIPISVSRGCNFHCSFCAETVYWRQLRTRSVDSVIAEIKHQKEQYKLNRFMICSSSLNTDKGWLDTFCERIIDEKLNIRFCSFLKPVPSLDKAIIEKLAKAGLVSTYLGTETFSQRLLNITRKGTRVDSIIDIVSPLIKNDIDTEISLMVGFPLETNDDIRLNIAFIKKCHRILDKKHIEHLRWVIVNEVRLEPYSDMSVNPARYNINIVRAKFNLPPQLDYLNHAISGLSWSWSDGVSLREKEKRMALLRKTVRRYKMCLY